MTLLLSVPAAASGASSPEKKYLSTRDGYVRRFEKGASLDDDRNALEELENLLRAILGAVRIPRLAGPGSISLETLREGAGFGQVDGLRFEWGEEEDDQDWLFVTTRGLLDDYLARDKRLPRDLVALARDDRFYRRVVDGNFGITLYAELPVKRPRSMAAAKAFVAAATNEIGSWPPKTLLVFAATKARIFVMVPSLEGQVEQVPACEVQWDELKEKYWRAVSAPPSFGVADRNAKMDATKYEQEAFEARSSRPMVPARRRLASDHPNNSECDPRRTS